MVTVLAVNYTAVIGWDTLIIDYLWFGLLVGVFLTGTFSMGMFKAEAENRGETGWPGPRECAFFLTVTVIFAAPALIFPVPLDTDAQGFGYLALMLRDGGSFTTLAPFHPDIQYLYSPGFTVMVAYLAKALNANIANIQLALGAILSVLFVWLSYDFGNEVMGETGTRRTGIAFACAALIGTGLLMAHLDSHYTSLLGLVFSLAVLTFVGRWIKHGKRVDLFAGAVCLAAVPITHPDTTIILIIGYVPALLLFWVAKHPELSRRQQVTRWLGVAVGIPLLGLFQTAPWLIQLRPLLNSGIASPFEIDLRHLIVMTVYQGGVIVILCVIGVWIGIRRRSFFDLLMIGWVVMIIDFSSLGILERIFPTLLAPILKYDYPFSVAWHGPIIPYSYLGGVALLWLIERLGKRSGKNQWEERIKLASLPVMIGVAAIVLIVVLTAPSLAVASKNTPLRIFGAFSSHADVRAMEWIKLNTPKNAVILNHPGPQEGDWVPVIAERDTIFFRPQPFFRGTERADQRAADLLTFWKNPNDPGLPALLQKHGVTYVIIPQIIAAPERTPEMYRWRPPSPEAILSVNLSGVSYLQRVFEFEGAIVYAVKS
jgi:hypothetical protein